MLAGGGIKGGVIHGASNSTAPSPAGLPAAGSMDTSAHATSPAGTDGGALAPSASDLAAVGVVYERLPLDDFQGALDRLRSARGYQEDRIRYRG